jgi:hypothetical protein
MKERSQYWRLVEIRNAIVLRKCPHELAFALAGFAAHKVTDALEANDTGLARRLFLFSARA